MQTYNNYIAGEWLAGSSVTANRNPSNLADIIGEYAQADVEQTKQAIAAAARAFHAWATGSIQERANSLDKIGSEILARQDELGRLLSRTATRSCSSLPISSRVARGRSRTSSRARGSRREYSIW